MKKIIEFRYHAERFNKIKNAPRHLLHKSSNDSAKVIKINFERKEVPELIEWSKKHQKAVIYILVDKIFTKQELLSAEILFFNWFSLAPQELSGNNYGTKYNKIGEYTIEKEKEEIFEQASPLYLNTSKLSKKKDIQIVLSSEIVVTKKFKEICEKNKITGCSFDPIFRPNKIIENGDATEYVSSESKKSDQWFQFKVTAQAGSLSNKTKIGDNFIDVYDPPPKNVKLLNRNLILGISYDSLIYINQTSWLNTDIATLEEKIRYIYPQDMILITQRFYRILLENNIKGFKAEPAYFI